MDDWSHSAAAINHWYYRSDRGSAGESWLNQVNRCKKVKPYWIFYLFASVFTCPGQALISNADMYVCMHLIYACMLSFFSSFFLVFLSCYLSIYLSIYLSFIHSFIHSLHVIEHGGVVLRSCHLFMWQMDSPVSRGEWFLHRFVIHLCTEMNLFILVKCWNGQSEWVEHLSPVLGDRGI